MSPEPVSLSLSPSGKKLQAVKEGQLRTAVAIQPCGHLCWHSPPIWGPCCSCARRSWSLACRICLQRTPRGRRGARGPSPGGP